MLLLQVVLLPVCHPKYLLVLVLVLVVKGHRFTPTKFTPRN